MPLRMVRNALWNVGKGGTVKPPISGQPSAWKKCRLLGGVRYWEKGHILAVEGNEKHYSRMFRRKFKNIFWLSK